MYECGVSAYVVGTAEVTVYFPVDYKGNADVRCEQCRYYGRTGRTCRLNGEVVAYPERYIGSSCPLSFD